MQCSTSTARAQTNGRVAFLQLFGPTSDTETFLSTYKPSANRQDILGGWYWCVAACYSRFESSDRVLTLGERAVLYRVINKEGNKGQEKPAEDSASTGRATFEEEGALLEAELTAECQRIKVSLVHRCMVDKWLR